MVDLKKALPRVKNKFAILPVFMQVDLHAPIVMEGMRRTESDMFKFNQAAQQAKIRRQDDQLKLKSFLRDEESFDGLFETTQKY